MNTKAIIIDAAFSLMKELPFDAITVQMILNRADVSRKTFYKYFTDKYELMELYYRNYMDHNISRNFNGHNYREVLSNLFDFVRLERSYFRHIKDLQGQGSFWKFLHDYSFDFYRSIKLHNEGREELTEEEKLTIVIIVDGEISVFKMLIEDSIHLSSSELADTMCRLIPDTYMEYQEKKRP